MPSNEMSFELFVFLIDNLYSQPFGNFPVWVSAKIPEVTFPITLTVGIVYIINVNNSAALCVFLFTNKAIGLFKIFFSLFGFIVQ